MTNNDKLTREELRAKIQQAVKDGDTQAFTDAFNQMVEVIGDDVLQQANSRLDEMRQASDAQVLAVRGVRQLTSKERDYYQRLSEAMRAKDPRQAVNNLDLVMPETVVDAVFDELQTSHPLLSHIQFMNTRGAIRMMMNTNGYQTAAWGPLCSEVVQELTSGFKEVDTSLLKLAAILPVCKAMLDLGPEWLDNFVRQVLYEAYANGLEAGIVAGNGNNQPIGMNRQVGDNVTVTGGVYPVKSPITVNDLSPTTVGGCSLRARMDSSIWLKAEGSSGHWASPDKLSGTNTRIRLVCRTVSPMEALSCKV